MNKCCFFACILFFGIAVHGQSLIGLNVDELSDTQILSIYEKGKSQGLNIDSGQQMAMQLGLSAGEAMKFKTRLEDLINSGIIELEDPFIELIDNTRGREAEQIVDVKNNYRQKSSSNIFGHNYFNIDLKSFKKSNEAKAPSNYVLGSGDELTISVFGSSYFQKTFKVSESGVLNLGPNFGRLKIRGMLLKNVEKLLRARFGRGFDLSKNTFDLSLSYGRNISINIVGEVNNPGTYSLTALNNAFHALVAAGGPTEIGSLRNVKVYRDAEVVEIIDFYQFFTNPKKSKIPFLQDGDFLMVPTISNLVTTGGQFKRIMSFEILPNETVSDLINFSSGFSANAYSKKITVSRSNDDEKIILDVESKDFSSLTLKDGDFVFSNVKKGKLENLVTINGALAQPGEYGYVEGMTIRDLINLAGGIVGRNIDKEISLSRLMTNGFYEISREAISNDDALDMKMSALDNVFIGFKSLDSKERIVSVLGAVKNPGEYIYSKGMTLEDALNRAGGLELFSDNDRVEITRQKIVVNSSGNQEISKTSRTLSLDPLIKENWSTEYKKSDFDLEPFDEIVIRNIKEFGITKKVFISGAVEFPGYYSILNNKERISDVVSRAGGISKDGDVFNAKIFRKQIGNVVLNLEGSLNGNEYNFLIKDSDSIHVPGITELITITGNGHIHFQQSGDSVLNVPLTKNFNALRYVREFSLGLSKNARKRDIYVSYPNGKFDRSSRKYFWTKSPKVRGGATIHVNKKYTKTKVIKEKRKPLDWNQFVATISSAAMGFGTVYALITRP